LNSEKVKGLGSPLKDNEKERRRAGATEMLIEIDNGMEIK